MSTTTTSIWMDKKTARITNNLFKTLFLIIKQ